MKFDMYLPENGLNEAGIALSDMIKDLDLGVICAICIMSQATP